MKHEWSGREQEWILDHGFRLNQEGLLLIPLSKWNGLAMTGKRISDPCKRTVCIPSDTGLCLLTEGMHFLITEE